MENLKPEGVWLGIKGVENEETAASVIKKMPRWK